MLDCFLELVELGEAFETNALTCINRAAYSIPTEPAVRNKIEPRTKNKTLESKVHFLPIRSANGPAMYGAGRVKLGSLETERHTEGYGVPINAPKGAKAPIHDNSCASGTPDNGVSARPLSFSFGETGDVHPIAVPTAMLATFTEKLLL